MLSDRQCQFCTALSLLIQKANELGYGCKIVELNRTPQQQQLYIQQGKSKTMDSRHLDNLAADLALKKDGEIYTSGEIFRPLGEYWESLGGRWGGRFGYEDQPKEVQDASIGWDSDHFEFRR